MSNSVSFQAQWIPRGDNELADYLSRIVVPDDWILHPDLFKLITFKWGPFDVDRMACSYNTHLPRFNSTFWCPGTEAVGIALRSIEGKECNNFAAILFVRLLT